MAKTARVLQRLYLLSIPVVFLLLVLRQSLGLSPWWNLAAVVLVGALFAAAATSRAVWHRAERKREAPDPVEVAPPVSGEWTAVNSPADKVPSHGVRGTGQEYAIDVFVDSGRPLVDGWWPVTRRPDDGFPAFGQPILAVADATVVHVSDGQRDHRSRNSYPGLLYLFGEGCVRAFGGVHRIFGNRVVLDLGGGVYAAYAHLKRGSIEVAEGDRVTAGQRIGLCGNSGNSSEPHLHFQLMDHPEIPRATGVPFRWTGVGVPGAGRPFAAAPAPR
ncbi:M23 family metallopeptidase [Nocardiopsis exhalans]|uniref:M23 family metallopeptidase n=1 Tax=Nocardiopsis exhalans TaxID=163604 RepID=A0ABY5DAU6_9ACTN|nr:M23 family metallopeptidase [Nocardiopsis exhalans]USY21466.1 M23 family metallopeptidase [Nocardiopsis exhalans]